MRRRRLVPAVALAFLLAACELPNFGAPESASEQGDRTLDLWRGTFVAAMVVGTVMVGLITYVLIRYRRRDDSIPAQRAHSLRLELIYTAVPVAIVAVLFAFNVATEDDVTATTDDPDVRVEVVGFQWQWQFRYVDQDVTITGLPGDPAPELVLPVDRTTQLDLVAADVIHSFWVPEFLVKRDLIPGVENTIDVTPRRTGSFDGICAEYCGLDHWRMRFRLRVVSDTQFDEWLDEQRAQAS